MNYLLQRALAVAGTLAMLAAPLSTHAQTVTTAFSAGDLIKGSMSTVYYFASDGKRYVFPNDKTYFTWYANFDTVKTIPDGALSSVPLGGNVTYRPGVKMVKITTDPRTYAVDSGGVLRHVTSEETAQTLYGLNWNQKIEDIPDPFFVNYRLGTAIEMASAFNPADVQTLTTTIAQDKNMDPEIVTVTIGTVTNGFVPKTITVKKGTEITWVNRDTVEHTVSSSAFNSPTLQAGETYSRRFTSVGSFDYNCGIHPAMQATINVVE